ncbi:two component transcriptional regulator, LytTR family [Mucilaginibacter sp. OK268]|uniref:LytR/AlgR family response regulator transcription factor n=1 Tax=Mucilaginibacter sp. OK268 TaxID=1881048 RepID=UPI000889FF95|nr:response regulator transcription factor [Mucilaginibacter sp. OK268]SDP73193.1 two component transcriptional regulator, LytTR family [Mucilaginibacter sp. OK268]
MKIRCVIVDDEPLAIQLMQKHLAQLDFFEVVATSNNALKALEILNQQPVDLLFLDIKMPQLSGLDFLKTLRNPPKTILTTAYREFALEGFELGVIDYLLKPITFDRFFKAIEHYLSTGNQSMPEILYSSEPQFIYLKTGHKFFKVDTRDILYAESLKDYVHVHTKESIIISKYKIGDLERELKDKGFLRIHRSFVVNLFHVTAFTANDVEIGKVELPVGDTYKQILLRAFHNR